MRKFLAVVKREYVQRVRTKFFIVATVLGPLFMAGFTILPAMMFGIKSGGPTRLAIVDQTGRMYERVAKELTSGKKPRDEDAVQALDQAPAGNNNAKEKIDQAGALSRGNYLVEEVPLNSRSIDDIRKTLEGRIQTHEIDGYVVLPANLLKEGRAEFRARNAADLFTASYVAGAISRAVRGQRLAEARIDERFVAEASEPIALQTTGAGGQESKGEASFYLAFGAGLLIYMSVLLYGQLSWEP